MGRIIIILIIALFVLVGCSPKNPFSLGDITLISTDVSRFNEKEEIVVTKDFENRGRYINLYIPLIRNADTKNIRANMRCDVPGYELFSSLDERGNRHYFKSYLYRDLDFQMEGTGSFSGGGTVLNAGSSEGTEILLLKKGGGAYFNLDIDFRGESPQKVNCVVDIISRDPPYVATKEVIFHYPGIKGFSVLD